MKGLETHFSLQLANVMLLRYINRYKLTHCVLSGRYTYASLQAADHCSDQQLEWEANLGLYVLRIGLIAGLILKNFHPSQIFFPAWQTEWPSMEVITKCHVPAHASGCATIDLMLSHSLWRCPNIKPIMAERLQFAEIENVSCGLLNGHPNKYIQINKTTIWICQQQSQPSRY